MDWVPNHGMPFSRATPMAPTVIWAVPVRTAWPLSMNDWAASAASCTSAKESVYTELAVPPPASTPALKPSTNSLASPTSIGPMIPTGEPPAITAAASPMAYPPWSDRVV